MNRDQEKIQIENEMNAMHGTTKEEILKDFEEFKDYLKKQVDRGKKLGLETASLSKALRSWETTSQSMKNRKTVKKCCCRSFGALRIMMRKNIWHSCWSNWLRNNKYLSRAYARLLYIVTSPAHPDMLH